MPHNFYFLWDTHVVYTSGWSGKHLLYFASCCTSINRESFALISLVVWIVYKVVAKNGQKNLWSGEQSRCGLGEEELWIKDEE